MNPLWQRARASITVPLIVLIVGFSFGLAANVIWSWPGGPVRVLGGALASLALPGAIHLWPRVPTAGTVRVGRRDVPVMRIVRALVMTLIAAGAAATTFVHAALLLIDHGEHIALAAAYPVITELAVVMGALAHRADQTRPDVVQVETAEATPVVGRQEPIEQTSAAAPTVDTLLASGAGRRRVAAELDISEHEARQLIQRHRERVPA